MQKEGIAAFLEKKILIGINQMKILALGGSGGMGRFAVKSLLNFPIISKIIVADLNESSATICCQLQRKG